MTGKSETGKSGTGTSDRPQTAPSGDKGVLGDKQAFKKDEPQDGGRDKKAKDDIGHMGEASRQNRSAKDER